MDINTKSLLGICSAYLQSLVHGHGLSPVFLLALFPHRNRAGSSGHFLSSSLEGKTVAILKEQNVLDCKVSAETKNTRASSEADMFFGACGKFCQQANPADPAQAPGS